MKSTLFYYFWSRHKVMFFVMTGLIVMFFIYGFWDWPSWVASGVFVVLFIFKSSRFNSEWRHTREEFEKVNNQNKII